jgi:DNA-binding NtrC family response regulator
MLTDRTVPPPGSVLIIENDNTLRGALVELLEFSHVPCLDTPSGCEGIDLFIHHQEHIDLVIIDMGLSDTNGALILQKLEAIRPGVKVIIISGQEKKRLDHQFEAYPNVSVVQKPFNTFGFLDAVSNYLAPLS